MGPIDNSQSRVENVVPKVIGVVVIFMQNGCFAFASENAAVGLPFFRLVMIFILRFGIV